MSKYLVIEFDEVLSKRGIANLVDSLRRKLDRDDLPSDILRSATLFEDEGKGLVATSSFASGRKVPEEAQTLVEQASRTKHYDICTDEVNVAMRIIGEQFETDPTTASIGGYKAKLHNGTRVSIQLPPKKVVIGKKK